MGGKKKSTASQPRVKDNLKPSSSDKAAQFLLNQTGGLGLPITFLSHVYPTPSSSETSSNFNHNVATAFVPLPQNPDAVGLNPNLLGILKRLDKKDSVTKQKALQDFCDALKQRDEDTGNFLYEDATLLAVLPFWPSIYTRITRDSDRKVREWAQTAMGLVADRVGRDLGTYIKQLLPYWTFATVDSHDTAATFAKQGLTSTFRGSKLYDACKVCARQLLDLGEQLLTDSLKFLSGLFSQRSNKKKQSHQSGECSVSRVDFKSESAFGQLAEVIRYVEFLAVHLSSLPAESKHLTRLRGLLSVETLWSPVSSLLERSLDDSTSTPIGNSCLVHNALYKLCSTLSSNPEWNQWCQNEGDGTEFALYLCSSTIGQLGNRSRGGGVDRFEAKYTLIPNCIFASSCSSSCWKAALSCLHNFPPSIVWSTVDWRQQLVPKLREVLRENNPQFSNPVLIHLLSLLSKVPIDFTDLNESDGDLIESLFICSLLDALELSVSCQSASDTESRSFCHPEYPVTIVTTLLECARFLIDRLAAAPDDSVAHRLQLRIVDQVILSLLSTAMNASLDDRCRHLEYNHPAFQNAYIEAILSNVGRLCINLGRSPPVPRKISILQFLLNSLMTWIKMDPAQRVFSIGVVNASRLIMFLDMLASADGRAHSANSHPAGISSTWCIDFCLDLAKHFFSKLQQEDRSELITPICLVLLCVMGYLPKNQIYSAINFEQYLFVHILPSMRTDLPNFQLSSSLIEGAISLWCLDPPSPKTACSPSSSTCLIFFDRVLPLILESDSVTQIFPRLSTLLLAWFEKWAEQLLCVNTPVIQSNDLLSCFTILWAMMLNSKYSSIPGIGDLRRDLFRTIERYANDSSPVSSTICSISDVTRFQTWQRLLKPIVESEQSVVDWEVSERWLIEFCRILLGIYSLEYLNSISDDSMTTLDLGVAEDLVSLFLKKYPSDRMSTLLLDLLMESIVLLNYVPLNVIRFGERFLNPSPLLATRWLNKLSRQIRLFYLSLSTEVCHLPSRCMSTSFGFRDFWSHFAPVVRLHQFGLRIGMVDCLSANLRSLNLYRICLGLIRGCLAQCAEPINGLSVEIGWPIINFASDNLSLPEETMKEPFKFSLSAQEHERFVASYGRLWYEIAADMELAELLQMWDDEFTFSENACANDLIQSTWNAVLFNRLRSVHPNAWPRDLLLAASCSDEPSSCWTTRFLFGSPTSYRRLNDLYLPVGIVRRCLPRQELLARFLSIVASPESLSATTNYEHLSRILESCTSLASVRITAPIYVSTYLPVLLGDCKSILSDFGDLGGDDDSPLWTDNSVYRACVSAICFLEILLLLWQPWQWIPANSQADKMVTAKQLGLIQLSLRLEQLRPSLDTSQWDFVLCAVTSWVCIAANLVVRGGQLDNLRSLFVYRAFRTSAALGAMFLGDSMHPINLESIISLKEPGISDPGQNVEEDIDPETDYVHLDTLQDDLEPEESTAGDATDKSVPTLNEDYFEEEMDAADLLLDNLDDELTPGNQIMFPRRGRLPINLRTDWERFFSSHLYSSLLPALFKATLLTKDTGMGDDSYIQALCSAFTTCPASLLIRMLDEQRHLVFEYLFEIDATQAGAQSVARLLETRSTTSWNDFSSGLRAAFTLSLRLISRCHSQCGQLLGHVLLTRLVCARTRKSASSKVCTLSNYLVHRLPTLWLSLLMGPLPKAIEQDLLSENSLSSWGRGLDYSRYFMKYTSTEGWTLCEHSHRQIISYLLSWDAFLSFFTSTGPQARSRLQQSLLGPSAALFDRLILTLGLLLPPPSSLESMVVTPCRLEPDERLLLPVSLRRAELIAALTSLSTSNKRRPIRLYVPLSSGDDREWRDAFSPDDSLICLPERRLAYDVSHLAVRLLRRLLSEAPALFRSWFNRLTAPSSDSAADTTSVCKSPLALHKPGRLRQLGNFMESQISRHLSAQLARDEVVLVHYKAHMKKRSLGQAESSGWFDFLKPSSEVGSISVRSRPLAREVIATYQATEDHSIEMSIQLPTNYPLGLTSVTCDRAPFGNANQRNAWSVQLSIFINNQNGSILDGIDLWQRNVRKKFEGVEECAICYSVLHNTNFTMPKMQCHTCRKLFHHACMYRWFTTSRNPACPLCRNLFFGPERRAP